MRYILKITFVVLHVSRTRAWDNYMDNYMEKHVQKTTIEAVHPQLEDNCNPLFWYPRFIPESCSIAKEMKIVKRQVGPYPPLPQPMAIPVPAPLQPVPYGVPIMPQGPMLPVLPQSYPQFPLSYGAPMAPSYSGLVPGLPGIVSQDGGINIMPFTDVYSEMLERHKQKLMMRDMEKILKKYKRYPWNRKSYRRRLYD